MKFYLKLALTLVVSLASLKSYSVEQEIMETSEFSFILKPSSLGGVGVFAVHDIPSGTRIFNTILKMRTMKIKDVPQEFLKYVVYINDEECVGPQRFDRMEIGWYINHSATPNIEQENVITAENIYDVMDKLTVYAVKDIEAGDEILVDYNHLNEPEQLKEEYYKL